MAAFFGEILPALSRAVDDEDDVLPRKIRQLEFEWNGDAGELSADSIIIAVGNVATCFLEANYDLGSQRLIGTIKEVKDDEDDDGFEAVSKKNIAISTIYQTNAAEKSVIFVLCKPYIPPEQIWPWTTKFFENIKPIGDIVVLTSSTMHLYQCENAEEITAPIVRSLMTTKKVRGHPAFPALEQPNMLKGIPAAVVTHGEMNQIPTVVYNCYTETLHLDLPSVRAFSPLLECSQFSTHVETEVAVKAILSKVRNAASAGSLYT